MQLDEKDKAIISALRRNSRYSIREIGKITGIRPSTVHQRIKKLVQTGVIERFTVKLNNKEVNENFIVFMLVKGETSNYITKKFIQNKFVREIFGVTGEFDVIMKLKFSDIEEFNKFIMDFRKQLPAVYSTVTMVVTTTIKEEL